MRALCFGLALLSSAVQAELVDVTPGGFTSEHELVLGATPAAAYAALTQELHLWWDPLHTYGGKARALTLDARAGGCFCESLGAAGSVEHMRVVYALPGKALTMQGGLGPLQSMGVAGSMQFTLQPHEQGSLLSYRYVVGGYNPGGLAAMAEPVDLVQLGQLRRLQQYLAGGAPLNR